MFANLKMSYEVSLWLKTRLVDRIAVVEFFVFAQSTFLRTMRSGAVAWLSCAGLEKNCEGYGALF